MNRTEPNAATLFACGPAHIIRRCDDGNLEVIDFLRSSVLRADGVLAAELGRFTRGEGVSTKLAVLAEGVADLAAALATTPEALDGSRALARAGFDTLFLELTATCNERCQHCYAGSSPEARVALDEGTCDAVIDEAAGLGFRRIQLTGGDPLLCRFLPSLVRRIAAHGIDVEIFTNGLALGETLLDELAPSAPRFAFSLYSHDARTHDGITATPESHRRTVTAIRRVRARGLEARVAMTVMAANAGDVVATELLAVSLGAASFGVAAMREAGRGGYFGEPLPWRERGHRPTAAARAERGTLCVTASGDVLPCIFNRSDVLGRVPERRLADVVRAPRPVTGSRASGALLDECRRSLQCLDCQRTAFALRALGGISG